MINVFGKGEVYKQLLPLLKCQNIHINQVIDDYSDNNVNNLFIEEGHRVLFCVGYKDMTKRLKRFRTFKEIGIGFINFTADNAIISEHVKIGEGTIINQGAIIDNYTVLGEACFVNIGAMVSHDSTIGDGVFIAPGANILGFVTIGERSFIGANATIIDHINIGNNVVIAAGSVVIDDVPDNVMVAGNPAVVKKNI